MELNKKRLVEIANELALRGDKIKGVKDLSNPKLVAEILRVTEDATALAGLGKETRIQIKAMYTGDVSFPAAPGQSKKEAAPAPKKDEKPAEKKTEKKAPKKPEPEPESEGPEEAPEPENEPELPPAEESPAETPPAASNSRNTALDGVRLNDPDLIAAANDMVEVLGLDTELVENGRVMRGRFIKAASFVNRSDNLKPETWAILKNFGLGPAPIDRKGKKAPTADDAKAAGKKVKAPGDAPKHEKPKTPGQEKRERKEREAGTGKPGPIPGKKYNEHYRAHLPEKTITSDMIKYCAGFAQSGKVMDREKLIAFLIAEHPGHKRDDLMALKVRQQIPNRFTIDRGWKFEEVSPGHFKVTAPEAEKKQRKEENEMAKDTKKSEKNTAAKGKEKPPAKPAKKSK